jgi:hypothetical protein
MNNCKASLQGRSAKEGNLSCPKRKELTNTYYKILNFIKADNLGDSSYLLESRCSPWVPCIFPGSSCNP